MAEIDFITAFGRLLRDGKLRDEFAQDPLAVAKRIQLRPAELTAWQQLIPADVEFQAAVLLRKRLALVKFYLPETSQRLGEELWPTFQRYARQHWPGEANAKLHDAFRFCQQLRQQQPTAVVAVEWNRLQVALTKHGLAFYPAQLRVRGKNRRGIQLLLRSRRQMREYFFHLGL